jgi:hypothetical protein
MRNAENPVNQLVGDIDTGHKSRDGQHQLDDIRQGQHRNFDKNQQRLAVTHQLIKQDHRPVDPIDPDQDQGEKTEMRQQLRQKVSVESWHAPVAP